MKTANNIERKRIEEEALKKLEEEKKRIEQEKKAQEEQRLKMEEEKRKHEEEKRKIELERQQFEEERRKRMYGCYEAILTIVEKKKIAEDAKMKREESWTKKKKLSN